MNGNDSNLNSKKNAKEINDYKEGFKNINENGNMISLFIIINRCILLCPFFSFYIKFLFIITIKLSHFIHKVKQILAYKISKKYLKEHILLKTLASNELFQLFSIH